MLKITIKVTENKGKNSCKVTSVVKPEDLSKASEDEKRAGAIVVNEINSALEKIKA